MLVIDLFIAVQRLSDSPDIHFIYHHDWVDKLAKGLIEDGGVAERKWGAKKLDIKPGQYDEDGTHYVHYHNLDFSEDGKKNDNINEEEDQVSCRACLEPITSGPQYKCKQCQLTLHKSCVELPNKKEIRPQDYPSFLRDLLPLEYSFLEIVKCDYCEIRNKYFNECPECHFESYARSSQLPSILHYPCHEHPLYVRIVPISYESEFQC